MKQKAKGKKQKSKPLDQKYTSIISLTKKDFLSIIDFVFKHRYGREGFFLKKLNSLLANYARYGSNLFFITLRYDERNFGLSIAVNNEKILLTLAISLICSANIYASNLINEISNPFADNGSDFILVSNAPLKANINAPQNNWAQSIDYPHGLDCLYNAKHCPFMNY